MKNLLIFISPKKNFEQEWITDGETLWKDETESLIKIQIDNSLELGWKREDIILVLNFPYEYNGVKALIASDETYCDFSPTASKINVICEMFDKGLIGDDLYWFHDNDAFQLGKLAVDVTNEIALTDYGKCAAPKLDHRWSTGVIFFRKEARDVFDQIKAAVYKFRLNEEIVLLHLMKKNSKNIQSRVKKINITYNFAIRKRLINKMYAVADKPIRVIHFHPLDPRPVYREHGLNNKGVVINGKNSLGVPLITDTLKQLFEKYAF